MPTFSVLTLNIRFGLAQDGANAWEHRKARFPAFFNRYHPDFICFQEVNDFQAVFFQTLLQEYHALGWRQPAPPFWQNNLIFYHKRWNCRRTCHYFLSFTPTIPSRFAASRWPRQCTLGHFEGPATEVVCVTTHFDFNEQVQIHSASLLFDFLADFPGNIPTVVAGDFNCEPASPAYCFLTDACAHDHPYLKRPEGQLPFKNVFTPPYPGTRHGFDGQNRGQHIDWLLYRGPVQPVQACVLEHDRAAALSDHFPVCAEFATKTSTATSPGQPSS